MREPLRAFLLSLTLVLCAGCVPFKAYDLPSVAGVVRDSVSHNPVEGAQIAIGSRQDVNFQAHAVSDKAGHFKTPEVTHTIWLPPLPFDFIEPDCTVTISASGYADQQFDFFDTLKEQRGRMAENVPEFELRRQ